MRVVQALHWLHDVLPSDRDAILGRLRNLIAHDAQSAAIAQDLRTGLAAMPIWMQSIVRTLVTEAPDSDGRAGAGGAGGDHHQHQHQDDQRHRHGASDHTATSRA
jgi:hypothetical protein